MSQRPFKNQVYAQFARIGMALASDRRLELLDLLAQGPRYVDALAAEIGISVANASQHLQVLRNAKLVEAEREGTRTLYRLADDRVLTFWLDLMKVGEERLPEIPQLQRQFMPETGNKIAREDLVRLLQAGEIILLDVRPAIEFRSGHIPGAIHVPLDELPKLLDGLPRNKRIVTYCRGTYCLMADEAVALLRQHGFDAIRLEGGWPEWFAERHQFEVT